MPSVPFVPLVPAVPAGPCGPGEPFVPFVPFVPAGPCGPVWFQLMLVPSAPHRGAAEELTLVRMPPNLLTHA